MSEAGRAARGRKRTPHATHRSYRRSRDARRETRFPPGLARMKGPRASFCAYLAPSGEGNASGRDAGWVGTKRKLWNREHPRVR